MVQPSVRHVSIAEFYRSITGKEVLYISKPDQYALYALTETEVLCCTVLKVKHKCIHETCEQHNCCFFEHKIMPHAKQVSIPPSGLDNSNILTKPKIKDTVEIKNERKVSMATNPQNSVPQTIAPQAAQETKGQKDAAVKDAERFINTLFKGLMGDLDEKIENLQKLLTDYVNAKFDALQKLIGFDGVKLEDVEASIKAETPQQKPKATPVAVVTLKSKVESLVTGQLDDAKQALKAEIDAARIVAQAAQDNLKLLEDRLKKSTVTTTSTTTSVSSFTLSETPKK